jgi:hypothetical protein
MRPQRSWVARISCSAVWEKSTGAHSSSAAAGAQIRRKRSYCPPKSPQAIVTAQRAKPPATGHAMKCSAAEVIVAVCIEPRVLPAETKLMSARIAAGEFWPIN